ncbi:MAG: malate dehydrogenase, partial [Acidobacteriia bacterium]|nr:malate dehydrogenase [Terriglobia bacterium]
MVSKIGVVGGGNIGGVLVQEIVRRRLARSVGLVDVAPPDLAKGKCLDIAEGTPILHTEVKLSGGRDYDVLAGSE